jgi:archaellum component FlaC
MTDLEKELLQTFKNFVNQYEADKKAQEDVFNTLSKEQAKQTNNLVQQIQSLTKAVNTLSNRVEELEKAYQDILTVLEE